MMMPVMLVSALIRPTPRVSTSQIVQKLEGHNALFILSSNDAPVLAMHTLPRRITEGHIRPAKKKV
jgi:hypothetical protein